MNMEFLKPILAMMVRHALTVVGGAMLHGGWVNADGEAQLEGAGMVLAGVAWAWWQKVGQAQVAAMLKKLTDTTTTKGAVAVATELPAAKSIGAVAVAKVDATAATGKIVAMLALLILGTLMFAQPSFAQGIKLPLDPLGLNTKASPKVTKDAVTLWNKIVAITQPDLAYASAQAASAKTNAADIRKQCWDGIAAVNKQAAGIGLLGPDGQPLVKPDPHVFVDIETLAEIMDSVSPQGQLFTSCAGAAQLAKATTLQFISAVITGAAGFAALPAGF